MKNKSAQNLGRLSWKSRSKGKTKKERSEMMSKLAKEAWNKRKLDKNVIHKPNVI